MALQVLSAALSYWWVALSLFVAYLAWEQWWYRAMGKRSGSVDPPQQWVVPFVGSVVQMVRDPYKFWHWHFDQPVRTWNALVGRFMVIFPSIQEARQIFKTCGQGTRLWLHPNAHKLLSNDNLAFLNGEEHRKIRQQVLPLFSVKSLGGYVPFQYNTIKKHLTEWQSRPADGPWVMQDIIFAMNIDASTRAFVGPNLKEDERQHVIKEYRHLTQGFLHLPFGSVLNRAVKARHNIIEVLTVASERAHKRALAAAAATEIAAEEKKANGGAPVAVNKGDAVLNANALAGIEAVDGNEPVSLLDRWVTNQIANGDKKWIPYETAGCTMLDFLFASQDASTSSLCWCIHLLAEHPKVLDKLRASLKETDAVAPTMLDRLANPYLNAVVKEVLRFRPPATIVPHEASEATVKMLGMTSPLPKGALLVPSIWSANRTKPAPGEACDANAQLDDFLPERWLGAIDSKNDPKNIPFLTFGDGPHGCLGQNYAQNQIRMFLMEWCNTFDWERNWDDPKAKEITYVSTIYPTDGCKLKQLKTRVVEAKA